MYAEIKKLWRGVAVEGIDESKIEDYLDRQGITSMQDLASQKVICFFSHCFHLSIVEIGPGRLYGWS